MGIFDWKHWLLLLVVVLLVFGGKRLKSLGGDLAEAIKSFRRTAASENPPVPEVQPRLVQEKVAEAPRQ